MPQKSIILLLLGAFLTLWANDLCAATTSYNDGDVFLGFRATSGTGATKDYLVNLGPATQFRDGPSKTLTIGNIGADLAAVFGADWYTRQDRRTGTSAVQYAVIGVQVYAGNGDPDNTIYVSSSSETPWTRDFDGSQSYTGSLIDGMRFAYVDQNSTKNSDVAIIQNVSGDNSYASYEPGGVNSGDVSFQTYIPTIEAAPDQRLYLDRLESSRDSSPGTVLGFFTLTPQGQLSFNFGTTVTQPEPAQLVNLSTRLRVQIGDNVLIGGFIPTGKDPKKVLIRALGPSLANVGVADYLPDPTLELRDETATLSTNDDWGGSVQKDEIGASGLAPTNSRESAIMATLSPGHPYTVIVRGKGYATGIGLVEVYDLATDAHSKLGNMSTRGFVQAGSNVLIGGLVVGNGSADGKAIIRAIGPSLAADGVTQALSDPTLELHDGNGALYAQNDDWRANAEQAAQTNATGLAPSNAAESAFVVTLPPGSYTAIVAGKGGASGVALVEVYDLN